MTCNIEKISEQSNQDSCWWCIICVLLWQSNTDILHEIFLRMLIHLLHEVVKRDTNCLHSKKSGIDRLRCDFEEMRMFWSGIGTMTTITLWGRGNNLYSHFFSSRLELQESTCHMCVSTIWSKELEKWIIICKYLQREQRFGRPPHRQLAQAPPPTTWLLWHIYIVLMTMSVRSEISRERNGENLRTVESACGWSENSVLQLVKGLLHQSSLR